MLILLIIFSVLLFVFTLILINPNTANKGLTEEIARLKKQNDILQKENAQYHNSYTELAHKWGRLVRRINDKGGEEFLKYGKIHNNNNVSSPSSSPNKMKFTAQEIKQLIFLCHPDKHNGQKAANDLTAKLLSLRS